MKAAGIVTFGTDLVNPDFAAVASAMGMFGRRVEQPGDLDAALIEAFAHDGRAVVDVVAARQELSMRRRRSRPNRRRACRCTQSGPSWPAAARNFWPRQHQRGPSHSRLTTAAKWNSLSSGTRVDNREFHFGERYGSDCQAGRGMAAAMLCPSHAGTARRASADPDTVTLPSIRQWDQDTSPRQISVRVRRLLSTVTVTS